MLTFLYYQEYYYKIILRVLLIFQLHYYFTRIAFYFETTLSSNKCDSTPTKLRILKFAEFPTDGVIVINFQVRVVKITQNFVLKTKHEEQKFVTKLVIFYIDWISYFVAESIDLWGSFWVISVWNRKFVGLGTWYVVECNDGM